MTTSTTKTVRKLYSGKELAGTVTTGDRYVTIKIRRISIIPEMLAVLLAVVDCLVQIKCPTEDQRKLIRSYF